MKKISATALILLFAIAANAQAAETFDPLKDRQLFFDCLNIAAVLTVIYLVSSFILKIFQGVYTFRLKNRILDKGTEENIIKQLIQPEKKDNQKTILQWFFMLLAIGIGLVLIKLIQPFGIHSLAILAFSMAAGFGGYYYFSKQEKGI